jgi:thiol-disulfide isomerase/thioredoxin
MPKKVRRRRKQKQNPFLSIGIGLFLVGMAVVLFTSGNAKSNPSSGVDESSVLPVEVNFPAPELSLENIHGMRESLADYRDDVILVNHWATWCPPCKAEMPTLEAYYEEHASEGFSIIAIEAGDSRDIVSQFAEQYNLQFPVWLDPDSASLSPRNP